MRTVYVLLCTGFLLLSVSCQTLTAPAKSSTISYLQTAKTNYEEGNKALANYRYDDAVAYFEHVRTKYPYSKYAALSDLAIGDTHFRDGAWLKAAGAYEFFVRFHPTHEKVGYAYFRIAKANYKAIPSDFFLFPPGHTKDRSATQDALDAVTRYLDQFAQGEHRDEAIQIKQDLESQLAAHDLDVAKFYEARSKHAGAKSRYLRLVSRFPNAKEAPYALFEASRLALLEADGAQEARDLLARLLEEYPSSDQVESAQQMLARLPMAQGDSEATN